MLATSRQLVASFFTQLAGGDSYVAVWGQLLALAGCPFAQGHFFAEPMQPRNIGSGAGAEAGQHPESDKGSIGGKLILRSVCPRAAQVCPALVNVARLLRASNCDGHYSWRSAEG
jgi:hypothetical protein